MAIQMRRGALANLDTSKLVAGEIVVATDEDYVGVAKAPSQVIQLATTDMLELPVASANTLGGVKVGNNLSIDQNGVLSATGGGGTTVVANPSGTATDDLTKIQIGQTIYNTGIGNWFSGEEVDTGFRFNNQPVYVQLFTADIYTTSVNGAKVGEVAGTIKSLGALHAIDYSDTSTGYADLLGGYASGNNYYGNGVATKKGTNATEVWIISANAMGTASALKNVSILLFYVKVA